MNLVKDDMIDEFNEISAVEMDVNETVNMLLHESLKSSLRLSKRVNELGLDKIRRRKTNKTMARADSIICGKKENGEISP